MCDIIDIVITEQLCPVTELFGKCVCVEMDFYCCFYTSHIYRSRLLQDRVEVLPLHYVVSKPLKNFH